MQRPSNPGVALSTVDEPCVRCKRRGRPIGKITPYGPACNSCAKYFRTPQQAGASQERANTLGDERARTQPNHGTCSLCRRHRRLSAGTDGTMLCGRCLRSGMVACPQCRGAMPAGHGTRCESCYWIETFERRLVAGSGPRRGRNQPQAGVANRCKILATRLLSDRAYDVRETAAHILGVEIPA